MIPDAVPDTWYLEEEEGNNNYPRSFQLKMCIFHLVLSADFDRGPVEESKLIKKILKVSAFPGSSIKVTSGSPFLHQVDISMASKGGIFFQPLLVLAVTSVEEGLF